MTTLPIADLSSLLSLLPAPKPRHGHQVMSDDFFAALRFNNLKLKDFTDLVKKSEFTLISCHCDRNYISRYAVMIEGVCVIRPGSASAGSFHALFNHRLSEYQDLGWDGFHDRLGAATKAGLVQYCIG